MTSPFITLANSAFATALAKWGEAATFTPNGAAAEDCTVILVRKGEQVPFYTETEVTSTKTSIFWQDGAITDPEENQGDKFKIGATEYAVDKIEVQNGAYGKATVS